MLIPTRAEEEEEIQRRLSACSQYPPCQVLPISDTWSSDVLMSVSRHDAISSVASV